VEKIRLTEFLTSTFHKWTPDGAVKYAPIYRMAAFKCIIRRLQKTRKLEPMVTRVQQHPMLSPESLGPQKFTHQILQYY